MMKAIFVILLTSIATACSSQNYPYSQAELIGGYDSLYKKLKTDHARLTSCGTKGRVYVTFEVMGNGTIKNCRVVKGICPKADSIAVNIVRTLAYTPAQKNGVPIESTRTIFIPFEN